MSASKNKKIYQKPSFYVGILLILIIIPLLIINICIVYSLKKNPDKMPNVFGYIPMAVISGSMETSIMVGDLIIVKMVDPTALKENDIITFIEKGTDFAVAHRILEINADDNELKFITKGDNNAVIDNHVVTTDEIQGVYLTKFAGLGNVVTFLSEPLGIVIMSMSMVIIIMGIFIIDSKFNKKRMKEILE